jgi:ABC-type multidrug transport system fused ATPase/permease subunit
MIAHRLNTLRCCNLILVLDEGRLTEIRQTLPELPSVPI